jgi:oxygen-independent coproporphyrinogen-3 oxidase
MGKLGVYIQVPFCQTKCTYCNFHTGVVSAGRFAPYAEAVCREIREHAALLRAAGVEWWEGLEPVSQMLQATSLRTSGVETPECAGFYGTAEEAAEKGSEAFPQGLKPKEGRALFVGAKAPTPSAAGRAVVDTVYIGGGTPSLLEAALLADMLRALRETFACAWEEVTLEADPETIEAEKAGQWVAAGINRISLGTQSFVDEELKAAGRLHRREDIYRAMPILHDAGICNISFDLIAGLPKQSRQSWHTSLDELVALSPEHVSVYMMEIDEGSRLGLEVLRGGARYSARDLPSEEEMAEFYETAQAVLKAAGYEQYEISNWAKPGYASRHNLKYWRRQAYLGFGAGAHSFSGTQRWANVHDAAAYVAAISAGRSATESVERVTREQALEEELFLGLRQLGGIDLMRIQREYRVNLEEKVGRLASAGMIEREGELVRLAAGKLSVSNEVIVELLR